MCETKRRWSERDMQINRYAHGSWVFYYKRYHPQITKLDYMDFITNLFYLPFIKFATFCINNHVVNIHSYMEYLVSHKITVDKWAHDEFYTKFITNYLKTEDSHDAIKRSINTLEEMCKEQNIKVSDAFNYLNENKLCQKIYQGTISPWLLYNSESAMDFMNRLNDDQVKLIYDFINPDIWRLKIFREANSDNKIKSLVKEYHL